MPKTQKSLGISQLRVGIFVLIALVVLGFLIINSTGDFNPFAEKLTLKARFASADGLREGAEVQLAGVPIGKVEEVRMLPPDSPEDSKIEAVMSVDTMLDGQTDQRTNPHRFDRQTHRHIPFGKRQIYRHHARNDKGKSRF